MYDLIPSYISKQPPAELKSNPVRMLEGLPCSEHSSRSRAEALHFNPINHWQSGSHPVQNVTSCVRTATFWKMLHGVLANPQRPSLVPAVWHRLNTGSVNFMTPTTVSAWIMYYRPTSDKLIIVANILWAFRSTSFHVTIQNPLRQRPQSLFSAKMHWVPTVCQAPC